MRTSRMTVSLLLTAVLATGCGTRLNDSAFTVEGDGDPLGAPDSSSAAGPVTYANAPDPSLTATTGPGSGSMPATTPSGGGQTQVDGPTGASDSGGEPAPSGSRGAGPDGSSTASEQPAEYSGNRASDVGVTAATIKVGNIVSKGGALGPDQFTPSYYGANAYFRYINATRGGIHGRQVEFLTCDDKENGEQNIACAQRLVEGEQVFAFVANNSRAYSGAEYVSEQGVPDIAGQPIGTEYYTFPNLFGALGGPYVRDGEVGDKGTMYWFAGLQGWYAEHENITKAAVLYYPIPISKQTGQIYAESLEANGVETLEFEVNPALPNFDSLVIQMESEGVDAIFDAMDLNASRNLCQAMERRAFSVKVKATTIAGWSRAVGDLFPEICLQSMWVSGTSRPISDTDDPEVALFNEVMSRVYNGQFDDTLAQWAFEGWMGARLFAEQVEAMGATPTRAELIDRMNSLQSHGLEQWMAGDQTWQPTDWDNPPTTRCVSFAKWDMARRDFVAANELTDCDVSGRWLPYEALA